MRHSKYPTMLIRVLITTPRTTILRNHSLPRSAFPSSSANSSSSP